MTAHPPTPPPPSAAPDWTALREAAEAASPGWNGVEFYVTGNPEVADSVAPHLEAANPTTVLALLTDLATAHARITALTAEVGALREALEALLELCDHGDFRNGVTDPTGSIDEGDVIAGRYIDRARTALAGPSREGVTDAE